MKVYYAHVMGLYNTPQEVRDIKTLTSLGFEVINPNSEEVSKAFKKELESNEYLKAFDNVFGKLVRDCEVFAFKALPDGRISGGVGIELKAAQEAKKLIIELPSGTHSRIMDGEATREYLRDIGER